MELIMPDESYYWRNREKCIADTKAWKEANPDRARKNSAESARRMRETEAGRERLCENVKAYAKRHPDRIKVRQQAWYAANGAEYSRKWHAANRVKNPIIYILRNAKNRAKKIGAKFNIDASDVNIPTVCPVLGIELKVNHGGGWFAPSSPSLDRFDNAKGYVKGNVRVISWRANMLKRDGTLDEFRRIVSYMELA